MNIDSKFNNNLNTNSTIQIIFEKIYANPSKWNKWRQCREMIVPLNINEIKPGQYCELYVGGGGYYCQWYYYRTIDNRHMLIFRTPNYNTDDFSYSGREIDEIPKSFGSCAEFINTQKIPVNLHIASFDETTH